MTEEESDQLRKENTDLKVSLVQNTVLLTPTFFAPLNEHDTNVFNAAIERYSTFLGRPVRIG